jgi:hypothetical protein
MDGFRVASVHEMFLDVVSKAGKKPKEVQRVLNMVDTIAGECSGTRYRSGNRGEDVRNVERQITRTAPLEHRKK